MVVFNTVNLKNCFTLKIMKLQKVIKSCYKSSYWVCH